MEATKGKRSEMLSDEVRSDCRSTSTSGYRCCTQCWRIRQPGYRQALYSSQRPSCWNARAGADDGGCWSRECKSADSVGSDADICRRFPKASKTPRRSSSCARRTLHAGQLENGLKRSDRAIGAPRRRQMARQDLDDPEGRSCSCCVTHGAQAAQRRLLYCSL
jgi:hypothetical protein